MVDQRAKSKILESFGRVNDCGVVERCWKEVVEESARRKIEGKPRPCLQLKRLADEVEARKRGRKGRDGNQGALGFKNGYNDLDHRKV